MLYSSRACEYDLEYIESKIYQSVLWENHCHAQFEMIAVLEGEISVMLEGRDYRLQENQTIIIPPLCYHSVTVIGGGIYRRITALFGADSIPEVLKSELSGESEDISVFFSSNTERLMEVCQNEDASFYAPLVQSLMVQIFYEARGGAKRGKDPKTDEFLQRVVFYIDKHLNEKILLSDIAKYTSRSKSSFCHLFEEKMRISPKQYILRKRLALASKLISEGTPPTVAASQVGYENYSNFYRMYIRHVGKSPTKSNK